MSTAWYRPNAAPKLLQSFPHHRRIISSADHDRGGMKSKMKKEDGIDIVVPRTVEVWNTTCIVTNFGKNKSSNCGILVNPSNPSLLGVKKFPYFPKGGPEPTEYPNTLEHHIMGYVSRWGGMQVQRGMIFPLNVVDGLVHQLGGWKLAWHCYRLPAFCGNNNRKEKCPVTQAVWTPPGGNELQNEYDTIVHTVPPFYEHHHHGADAGTAEVALQQTYRNALKMCQSCANKLGDSGNNNGRFALPLLGAGGRGFPIETAIDIAASESIRWRDEQVIITNKQKPPSSSSSSSNNSGYTLAFGIPSQEIAQRLADAIACYEI